MATAVASVSTPAFAEPTAAEKALARTLFEQGRNLAREGKWTDACPKFEESERLDHGIGTLFNLSDCNEHIGKTASAWIGFSEVADLAKRNGQAERETIARARANSIVPKLSKIKIRVVPPLPAGLEVKLDDKPVGAIALETDIPVDPGTHKVAATAPQKKPITRDIIVPATPGVMPVELPAFESTIADSNVDPSPPPPPPPPRREHGSTWHKPAAIGVGAVGLVAIGVGSFFGLRASNQWSDAQAACPENRCTTFGYEGWKDSKESATISNIGFAAGAVLIASAVVLWIIAPSSSSSSAETRAR
jgi:hypothetical protein